MELLLIQSDDGTLPWCSRGKFNTEKKMYLKKIMVNFREKWQQQQQDIFFKIYTGKKQISFKTKQSTTTMNYDGILEFHNTISVFLPEAIFFFWLRAQLFTSLNADLRQYIKGWCLAFSRCLNGTFPWRKSSVKALVN